MAIGSNDFIDKFGTQDTVTVGTGTSAVASAAFSASGDVVSGGWTNDDDAPMADFVLTYQYTSGSISQDGVKLYMRLMNIDGTADEPQPDTGYKHHYLGTFIPDSNQGASTNNSLSLGKDVALPNTYTSQVYEFYIENLLGVTITAGWTLKVTPKTGGPHA